MGHRSTTIAFIVVMLVVAVIWIIFKDRGETPSEEKPAPEREATEEAQADETTTTDEQADEEPTSVAETEEPVTEPEPPQPAERPGEGMSALALHVVDRNGNPPAALGVALVPLVGKGEVVHVQLPVEAPQTAEVAAGPYLVCALVGQHGRDVLRPAGSAIRFVRVMTLRPNHVETLALSIGRQVVVSGTVRDFDNQPLAGADVMVQPLATPNLALARPAWLRRADTTNTAGAFRIEQVPAGDLLVRVAKGGFTLSSREIRADFGDEVILHIVLAAGFAASGTVTTKQDAPIPGASVFYLTGVDDVFAEAATDEAGRYELLSLPHSGLGLFALADGFAYSTVPYAAPQRAGVGSISITLDPEKTIVGNVRYEDGAPVSGASVCVESVAKNDLLAYPAALETATDTDGAFTLHHLRDYTYRVVVTDTVTGQTVAKKFAAGTEDARFTIAQGCALTGRITDEKTNEPLAGAAVLAGNASATSGLDGAYELWLAPELTEVDVSVSADGYEPKTEPKVLLTGGETALDVVLVPVPVARCWLVDEATGETVIGAPVRWRHTDEPFARRSLRSSLEGEIAFYGARLSDEVHLEVRDRRYVPYIKDVTLGQINGKQIVLSAGKTIRGRIMNTREEPIAGAEVYVGEGFLEFADPFVKRVRSGSDGRYEMPGMSEQMYQLTAVHPDYMTTQSVGVDMRHRDVVDDVDIVMDEGVTVTGLVLDERNDPIPGAVVRGWGDFNYDVEQPGYKRSATTDAEGRFVLGRLQRTASGSMLVSASAHGYATTTASVKVGRYATAPEKEVVITLRPEAAIRGRAVDKAKAPIAGVRVYVRVNDLERQQVRTDAEGRFTFDGLLPGRYTLIFTRPGFLYKKLDVQVAGGSQPTEVEVVLERGAVLSGRVVNAATGEPVRIFGGRIATEDRLRSYILHVTGAGWFTTDTVPDGDYVLTIHAKGMLTTVEKVTVTGHAGPPDVTVRLDPLPR